MVQLLTAGPPLVIVNRPSNPLPQSEALAKVAVSPGAAWLPGANMTAAPAIRAVAPASTATRRRLSLMHPPGYRRTELGDVRLARGVAVRARPASETWTRPHLHVKV